MVLGENDYTNGKHEGRELVSLNKLEDKIVKWGEDRGIIPDVDPVAQFNKTMEEAGELAQGIVSNNLEEIKDAIGDIFVTLVMQTRAWGLDMETCVEKAYREIKDRKGKMVDGQFVKEVE